MALSNINTNPGEFSRAAAIYDFTAVPWRRAGIVYEQNEAFFDVVEEVSLFVDRDGDILETSVRGHIDCSVRLTGSPDLHMAFAEPNILDNNVSFHPSVRFKKWEQEGILSFIPPDGNFRLLEYEVEPRILPIVAKHDLSFRPPKKISRLHVTLEQPEITVDSLYATIPLPKEVCECTVVPNQGNIRYDEEAKVLTWELSSVKPDMEDPSIKGALRLAPGSRPPNSRPILNLNFTVPRFTASGLKIQRLDITGINYKPFKGVKYITKTGKYQICL